MGYCSALGYTIERRRCKINSFTVDSCHRIYVSNICICSWSNDINGRRFKKFKIVSTTCYTQNYEFDFQTENRISQYMSNTSFVFFFFVLFFLWYIINTYNSNFHFCFSANIFLDRGYFLFTCSNSQWFDFDNRSMGIIFCNQISTSEIFFSNDYYKSLTGKRWA